MSAHNVQSRPMSGLNVPVFQCAYLKITISVFMVHSIAHKSYVYRLVDIRFYIYTIFDHHNIEFLLT